MSRQSFKPTPEMRAKVRQLSGVGLPQDDIAKLLECSPKTLRKHFRRELDLGGAETNAMIAGYLYQSAKAGNVAAQIFWLKTRARWTERPVEEASAEGAPIAEDMDKVVLDRLKARVDRLSRKGEHDEGE